MFDVGFDSINMPDKVIETYFSKENVQPNDDEYQMINVMDTMYVEYELIVMNKLAILYELYAVYEQRR